MAVGLLCSNTDRVPTIDAVNKQVAITDLGSTNGTYIDGEQLENMAATELKIGSEIVFGERLASRYTRALWLLRAL